VDYRIRRAKSDLEGTGYVEIAAGQYTGERRLDGSLFVPEDAFAVIDGVIARHFPGYDRLAANDIPRDAGSRVAAEWREIAEWLPVMRTDEARVALNVGTWFGAGFDDELTRHRAAVIELLRSLADACDDFYSRSEWIRVLGA
jgi:hypothetical protein